MEAGLVAGDWKCTRILGNGSYGIVGLWENGQTKEKLAVKKFEIQSHQPPSEKMLVNLRDRYREEVSLMYDRIHNPHIVATKPIPPEITEKIGGGSSSAGDNDEKGYEPVAQSSVSLPLLGMEYCSGGDLRQLLKRPENLNGLPEKEIRRVLAHVSDAISYLHEQKIIHRDIKPENIVIQYEGPNEVVYKLSDLGFAKDLSGNESMCSTILGTLPYLAPEIYFGQKYDKTVDYWSFGLITFELMCGMRPFLPGESPAVWIPLVKKKDKEVIAIYRDENGDIKCEKDVPYNTHLSPLLRKCLVAWLPSMLQMDPKSRGSYVLTPKEWKSGTGDANALTRLKNMLNTKFLDIHAYPERLVFAIGRTIKVWQVQNWIAKETEISEASQIILTSDGDRLSPDDFAIKYLESGKDLYLLPKSGKEISSKIRLSKILTSFLSTGWKASRELAKNRMIWANAIYFVQRQLERVETLTKASEALRLYHQKTCTDELNQLDHSIDKAWHSLGSLIELEEKLVMLESRYELPEQEKEEASITAIKSEGKEFRQASKESLNRRPTSLELQPLQISQMRETYHKVLKLYESWRSAETENAGDMVIQSMEILVRLICEFVKARQVLIAAASANIRCLFGHIASDEELKEKIQILLSKMNSLIDQVFHLRIERQKKILGAGFDRRSPPKTLLNGYKSTATNSAMTQSLSCLDSNNGLPNGSSSTAMTQSLVVGSRRSSFSPDLSRLMEESMIIQNALSDAVAQVESLVSENAELESKYLKH